MVLQALTGVGAHLAEILQREALPLTAFTAVWLVLQIIFEFVVPAIRPGIYDSLGLSDASKGRKISRGRLAADARSKIICILQAIYLTGLCGYALMHSEELYGKHYASTPLTQHIVYVAASFFIWDVFVCFWDRESPAYFLHGFACLFVFLAALVSYARMPVCSFTAIASGAIRAEYGDTVACCVVNPFRVQHPFLHYMACVTLLFEASTPFLHVRKYLIQSNQGSGTAFTITSALFALSFFGARIVVGLWQSAVWWTHMLDLLNSGSAHNDAVVYIYLIANLLLSGLNVYWFSLIVKSAIGGDKPKKPKHA